MRVLTSPLSRTESQSQAAIPAHKPLRQAHRKPRSPENIAAGPDGNLWFTEHIPNSNPPSGSIGRITPTGVVTEFRVGTGLDPVHITAGPDGNLWFTQGSSNVPTMIGRITPEGVVTQFPVATRASGIAAGPDGNLWFLSNPTPSVGKITPSGRVTYYPASYGGDPILATNGITAGPDGNMWFTTARPDGIGRIGTGSPRAVTSRTTCATRGAVDQAHLKVKCRIVGISPSARVRWKLTRRDDGSLVARGRKRLIAGVLVVNLGNVDGVHPGRHRIAVVHGVGAHRFVVRRTVQIH